MENKEGIKNRSNSDHKITRHIITRYNWILNKIKSGVPLNCIEIAEQLDCSPKTAQRYINQIRNSGHRLEYVARLRGYVFYPPISDKDNRQQLIQIIRSAYNWGKNRKPAKIPKWFNEAENVLKTIK